MQIKHQISQILQVQADLLQQLSKLIECLHEDEGERQDEKFYSIKDTAQLLSMGESTVRRLISTGQLKAVRVGGKVLIPAPEIRSLVEKSQ